MKNMKKKFEVIATVNLDIKKVRRVLMKILYTGFKGINNSSYRLVTKFKGDKLFLTNSFSGLYLDIKNLNEVYDNVYMFALDKNIKNGVRIEKCAIKDSQLISSGININEVATKFNDVGINVNISEEPTQYLCNEAYWHMLTKFNRNVVFIHIPSNRNITDDVIERIVSLFE